MATAIERANEKIGRAIDGQIVTLERERETLLLAAARIAEIDAELVILREEKVRVDPKRPLRQATAQSGSVATRI
jgi:hypothetical protein